MKFLKKLLFGIVGLLVVASLGLWILAQSVSPETISNMVSVQLSRATGKPVAIKGGLNWHLLPRPSVAISDIQIGNMQGHDDYAVQIQTLMLNIKLSPMLHGKIVFNELNLEHWRVHLNTSAQGKTQPVKQSTAHQQQQSASTANAMAISRLTLHDGELVVEQQDQRMTIDHIQLDAKGVNLNRQPFTLRGKLHVSMDKVSQAQVAFDGSLLLDADMLNHPQRFIEQGDLQGQLKLSNIHYQQVYIDSVNASVKASRGHVRLDPLSANLYQAQSVGYATYSQKSGLMNIKQTATSLNAKQLMQDLSGHYLMSGSLDYVLNASLPVDKISDINAIKSQGQLSVHDGELQNVNFSAIIDTIKAKFDAVYADNKISWNDALKLLDTDTQAFTSGATPFKLASVAFGLDKGIFTADKIIVQTERLSLAGQGQLNLANQGIHGQLDAKINDTQTNSRLQEIQNALGGQFVLAIRGTLAQPLIVPDKQLINHVLRDIVIKKNIQHKLDKLDIPAKKIGKKLESLFR